MLGHSLGEYSALCSINSLNQKNAAKLLRTRGEAMQNAVKDIDTSMVAIIGLNIEEIEKQINKIKKVKTIFVRLLMIIVLDKLYCLVQKI